METHIYSWNSLRTVDLLYFRIFAFKAWTSRPSLSAKKILKYMGEVIEENGRIDRNIR